MIFRAAGCRAGPRGRRVGRPVRDAGAARDVRRPGPRRDMWKLPSSGAAARWTGFAEGGTAGRSADAVLTPHRRLPAPDGIEGEPGRSVKRPGRVPKSAPASSPPPPHARPRSGPRPPRTPARIAPRAAWRERGNGHVAGAVVREPAPRGRRDGPRLDREAAAAAGQPSKTSGGRRGTTGTHGTTPSERRRLDHARLLSPARPGSNAPMTRRGQGIGPRVDADEAEARAASGRVVAPPAAASRGGGTGSERSPGGSRRSRRFGFGGAGLRRPASRPPMRARARHRAGDRGDG